MTIERIALPRGGGFPLERTEDLTASVMGALFDVHPYTTMFALYARHRGAELPDPETTAVMRRGLALEPVVASEIKKRHKKWKIIRNRFYYRDAAARIGATPDFLIDGDPRGPGLLQTKTVASSIYRKHWTPENPPFWIALQAQTELMLTGARWGIIAPLVVGDFTFEVYEYEVPHHDGAQAKIRAAAADFWQAVADCREPTPAFDRDSGIIDALYPHEAPGKVVDLRGDNRMLELVEAIERDGAEKKRLETEIDKAETEIKAKLGDAEFAIVRGWRVIWKSRHRRGYVAPPVDYRHLTVKRDKQEAA
jgi:predicted phage-related endonuclease